MLDYVNQVNGIETFRIDLTNQLTLMKSTGTDNYLLSDIDMVT